MPRHRRSPKKKDYNYIIYIKYIIFLSVTLSTLLVSRTRTNFGDRLQCSWTSSVELSADKPKAVGLVVQAFKTVAEDIFGHCEAPLFSALNVL